MTDLTERLAAKLGGAGAVSFPAWAVRIATDAQSILPLLLSEPELVAGLPPEAKREVLRTLLGEQLEEIAVKTGPLRGLLPIYPEYGTATWYTVKDVLAVLAPERAP